jgi:hypothetical protein
MGDYPQDYAPVTNALLAGHLSALVVHLPTTAAGGSVRSLTYAAPADTIALTTAAGGRQAIALATPRSRGSSADECIATLALVSERREVGCRDTRAITEAGRSGSARALPRFANLTARRATSRCS